MSDSRTPVKLDFMSPVSNLSPRLKIDPLTTAASVNAAHDVGFLTEPAQVTYAKTVDKEQIKIDGRKLRKRAQKIQLNLKVFEEERAMILQSAEEVMDDPTSGIRTLGEFVVHAVDTYRRQKIQSVQT
jgi:hypothetical protein